MKKAGCPDKKQSQGKSFQVAIRGLWVLAGSERNFRIHLAFAVLALTLCVLLGVTAAEWIYVIILIAMVLSAEAVNTCLEYCCNLVSPDYHPLVRNIKDIAAGMVLLNAIISVVVGGIIFTPYIYKLFL